MDTTIIKSRTAIWSLKSLTDDLYQLTLSPSLSSWGLSKEHKNSLALLVKDYYFNGLKENEDFSIDPVDFNDKQFYQVQSVPNFSVFLLPKSWLEELKEFVNQWEE